MPEEFFGTVGDGKIRFPDLFATGEEFGIVLVTDGEIRHFLGGCIETLTLAIEMGIHVDEDFGYRVDLIRKLMIPCVWLQILSILRDSAGKKLRLSILGCKCNL